MILYLLQLWYKTPPMRVFKVSCNYGNSKGASMKAERRLAHHTWRALGTEDFQKNIKFQETLLGSVTSMTLEERTKRIPSPAMVKHGGGSFMMCVCFSPAGTAALIVYLTSNTHFKEERDVFCWQTLAIIGLYSKTMILNTPSRQPKRGWEKTVTSWNDLLFKQI